jgi:16S rRNA (uracil1498-N3)-methyltransferase
MSAGRFFVAPAVVADPTHVELPLLIANQVRSVLRLNVGDHLTLLDGTGMAYRVELTGVKPKQVTGRVIEHLPVATEPRAQVILHQGLLKATKFEWIIQKGTEIGLSAIVPVQCRRSIVSADDVSAGKLARWRSIATEAAEQSDRGRVPAVRDPLLFAAALADIAPNDLALLAYEGASFIPDSVGARSIAPSSPPVTSTSPSDPPVTIHAALATRLVTTPVHFFIGPEGGFAAEEVALAQGHGVQIVTLGPRILRAETAALVAATLVLDALGEMQ